MRKVVLNERYIVTDTKIHFQNEGFNISSHVFAACSATFARLLAQSTSLLTIETKVHRDTVIQFIGACQLREYSVTAQNANELVLLCDEWEVPVVGDEVREIIAAPENGQNMLLPSIRFMFEHGIDTSRLENQLHDRFIDFIDQNLIFDLPISILARVIKYDYDDSNFRRIFRFLIECLHRFGTSASCLFRGLRLDRLTCDEVSQLHSEGQFIWCFIGESASQTIKNLVGCNCKQQELISRENTRMLGVIEQQNIDRRAQSTSSRIEIRR
jgi:hypothetical protein